MKLCGFVLIVSLLALNCSGAVTEQAQSLAPVTAVSILKSREPTVTWDQRSLLKADFDFDGIDDYVLAGRAGGRYVVGIVKGPVTSQSKHWTLGFSQNPNDQGSLCSVSAAHIELEEPDVEGDLPPNSKGINLSDGTCDSFHIYWDKMGKRFVWSRN